MRHETIGDQCNALALRDGHRLLSEPIAAHMHVVRTSAARRAAGGEGHYQHWTEHKRDRPSFHREYLLESIPRVQLRHWPATQPGRPARWPVARIRASCGDLTTAMRRECGTFVANR